MWPLLFWLPRQEPNEKPRHSGCELLRAGTQLKKSKNEKAKQQQTHMMDGAAKCSKAHGGMKNSGGGGQESAGRAALRQMVLEGVARAPGLRWFVTRDRAALVPSRAPAAPSQPATAAQAFQLQHFSITV